MTKLEWQGPITMNAPSPSLTDERLNGPGVYVYVQKYPDAKPTTKTAFYIGKSVNLRKRMFEHIAGYAGTTYWLRDAAGQWVYNLRDGPMNPAALGWSAIPQIALKEAHRMMFCWAPDMGWGKSIEEVENHLIAMAQPYREINGKQNKDMPIVCDNGTPGEKSGSKINNAWDAIEDPSLRDLFTKVFSETT